MAQPLWALDGLEVNGYRTAFLRQVRREALPPTLGGPSLYITSFPSERALEHRELERPPNPVLHRKARTAEMLPSPCTILSLVRARSGFWRYHGEMDERPDLVHFRCFSGRGADFVNTLLLTREIVRRRADYETLVFCNFYFYSTLPVWIARTLLGKKIVVDFQDDYESRSGFWGSKVSFRVLSGLVDAVIAIVEPMARHFDPGTPVTVVNSFADLTFVEKALDAEHETIQLLYAGSLDPIRGGDMLRPLSAALEDEGIRHHLHVAGKGPHLDDIRALAEESPSVTYHGFLSSEDLERLMDRVHVGLVLQKPDHPFSEGSFPSKVDVYAEADLPALVLETNRD